MRSLCVKLKNELQTNLLSCQNHLLTLPTVTCARNAILQWFRGLCELLAKTITSLSSYYKEIDNKSTGFIKTLLLYLTQIITSLSLLINIFVQEEEIKHTITEARNCVSKQISCCLESLEVALKFESVDDPSGNFVKWMDAALDAVAEINADNPQCEETRQLFEEVLSHAMSIAQVSLTEDSKIIRGSCQAVLSALNSLEQELVLAPPNAAMINLFVDACSNKLCLLERKVNTAVLKLCLDTFSQFTRPLDKIRAFTADPLNKAKSDEFDALVADFDLHVDRIMQLGLFAVACSSDFGRGIKIRSCLASLEALESELVPALTSVLSENSVHNANCAEILMAHWRNQALCLQGLIYLIVDPFAFCQVVYEQCVEIVDDLTNSVRRKCSLRREDVGVLLAYATVLQTFLNKARSEFSNDESKLVENKLNDFNEVLQEVESSAKVLLIKDNTDSDSCKRVLKRCKILLIVMKRLWYCFADDVLSKDISLGEKQKSEVQVPETGNGFLDHIINRGKQILQDRSVLYKTPIKMSVSHNKDKGLSVFTNRRKEMALSKFVHLRKLTFVNVHSRNETGLDLQITDILNELSTSLAQCQV